jgi:hypothetical protein
LRIGIIDGQGGGIGKYITERLRKELPPDLEIIALGTNALATAAMLRAGANDGASGENAIVQTVPTLDLIAGSLAIITANSFLGELTPAMAAAIASAPGKKLLLALGRGNVEVIGGSTEPFPHQVDLLIKRIADKGKL